LLFSDGTPSVPDNVATGSYVMCMRAIGIKQLKNKLSEYVKFAAAGEIVLVTDRDKVVAELGPPNRTRARDVADAALAQAVRDGALTPGAIGAGVVPPRTPLLSFREVMGGLDDDRGDR
jgi:antitoxin (DNA-binding transcriptional repressor) of toxin-antitoxin stability system